MSKSESENRPRSSMDDVIDLYKKDVDRTLLRENLKLTVEERLLKFDNFMATVEEIRRAGKEARARKNGS